MNPTVLLLRPVDAWFFRDGRPYNKLESNQADVQSAFPPSPATLAGSIRAALARQQGWNGAGRWSPAIAEVLGDGFEDLGRLSFSGPWLVRKNGAEPEPLFPAPLHLLGRLEQIPQLSGPRWVPVTMLVPGKKMKCDIGEANLPLPKRADGGRVKGAGGLWITAAGLHKVLAGELPARESIVPAGELWQHEFRVGLVRDESKRTTGGKEHALYSPSYVRLCPRVSLAVAVRGLPEDWAFPAIFPLGGEGRAATCEVAPRPALPPAPCDDIRRSKRLAVTLLTPLCMPLQGESAAPPLPGEELPGVPSAKIISACVERPCRLGGWDSLNRRPLPLTPFLPAASTWFCEVSSEAVDRTLALHGGNIGPRAAYGFGRIVLGTWRNEGASA